MHIFRGNNGKNYEDGEYKADDDEQNYFSLQQF